MSQKLRDLIREVRACKTAAEERSVISKECALIRTTFKNQIESYRHRNVAKLLFIHMLGYPTDFGQMECLKLIASHKFTYKRVGYLGLTQLLYEDTEVLMLVTNSIKNDLAHSNQYVNGLALSALGNIANPEMCRALIREIEDLLGSSNPYVKKKAAMCAMRIVRKVDDTDSTFTHLIGGLIEDRNHGVMLSGCALVNTILEHNKSLTKSFRKFVPALLRSLKNLQDTGHMNPEYDIAGLSDPFLQTKILRLVRILAAKSPDASEEANDLLAQIATNTEGSKNAGNAILYEAVTTIINIDSDPGLRVLAVNILGRFLLNRDNNIRYVALQVLQRVVRIDSKTVQRHRQTVVECLRDPDISIRKRALDVTYSLFNEENIKPLTKDLLNFLLVADNDFKGELVSKVCLAVDKFSPNKKWHIDTLIKVMCLAGNYVPNEMRDIFISTVCHCTELHKYCAFKLYYSTKENILQESLVQCCVWMIGEFSDILLQQGPTMTELTGGDGFIGKDTHTHTQDNTQNDVLLLDLGTTTNTHTHTHTHTR
eukprot:GHVR01107426.1.p1 GENE.GHVR01107426.1~~GHVR01107426.1.p1  ORF type:complete len:540 (+),score=117.29 GHVR01107426.1:213-1832(+)